MMIFVFDKVENNVEKGENDGYQNFLLFPHCTFRTPLLQGPEKHRILVSERVWGVQKYAERKEKHRLGAHIQQVEKAIKSRTH